MSSIQPSKEQLSLILSDVFDDIGLNDEMIKRRRQWSLSQEEMIEAIGDAAVFGFTGVDTFQANMSNETVNKATYLASYEPAPSSSASSMQNYSFDPVPSASANSMQNYSFDPVPSASTSTSSSTSKQKTDENFEKKSKKNDNVKDADTDVISLLKQIHDEQKKTNKLLQQLFVVNIEQ